MATPQAVVQALEGEVSVTRNGQEVNIKAGDYLLPGDVIQTGDNGRLSLEFPGVEGQTPAAGVMSPGGKVTLGEQPGPSGQQIVVLEDTECFEFTTEVTEDSAAAEGTPGLFGGDFAGGGAAVAGAGAVAAGLFAGGGSSSAGSSDGGATLNTSADTSSPTPSEQASSLIQDTVEDPSTLPENLQTAVEEATSADGWILTDKGWVRAGDGSSDGGGSANPVESVLTGGGTTGGTGTTDGGSTSGTGGSTGGTDGGTGTGTNGGTGSGTNGGTGNEGGTGTATSNPIQEVIETVRDESPIEDSANAVVDGVNQTPAGEPASPATTEVSAGAQEAEAGSDSLLDQLAGVADLDTSGGVSDLTGSGIVTEVANTVADATSSIEPIEPVTSGLQEVAPELDSVIDQVVDGVDSVLEQLQDAAPPEVTEALATVESGITEATAQSDSPEIGDMLGTDAISADSLSADSLNPDTLAQEVEGILGSPETLAQQLQNAGSDEGGSDQILGDISSGISSTASQAGVDLPDDLTGGGGLI